MVKAWAIVLRGPSCGWPTQNIDKRLSIFSVITGLDPLIQVKRSIRVGLLSEKAGL